MWIAVSRSSIPHVHVQPENQVRPRHQLHVLDNVLVTVVGINLLRAPVRKRMRRHRRQPQPILLGQPDNIAPQHLHFRFGFLDVPANPGPHLHHRLVHLRLHPLLQDQFALLQDFDLNVRPQIPRLRIYRLIFLFNPDGESRCHLECSCHSEPRVESVSPGSAAGPAGPHPFAFRAKRMGKQVLEQYNNGAKYLVRSCGEPGTTRATEKGPQNEHQAAQANA
jgi:hypothetical protein